MTGKSCKICGVTKDISEFSKNGKYFHSYCRPCEVSYKKSRRQADRDLAHFRKVRDRAKTRGLDFDLVEEDFEIPEYCPVMGIRLSRGKDQDSWPSVDRIDPNGGYTKDNVIVVSFLANKIKNNASVEQLRKVYEFYAALQTRSSRTTNYAKDLLAPT
jgi:uncharacterized Zn finger protein (UPF0148 family)